MASERQFDANRRNARRSTGPRTSKGKAKSARNALKHGLLAESALLPDEDEREFRDFASEGMRELDPRGWLESVRAEQIVEQAWRCRRPARVEAGLFRLHRAELDHKHYWDCLMQSRTDGFGQAGDDDGAVTNDTRQLEAMAKLSAAVKAKRSESALLASGFMSWAVNGDPFGKLQRYETAAYGRLGRMIADYFELKAKRNGVRSDDLGEDQTSSF